MTSIKYSFPLILILCFVYTTQMQAQDHFDYLDIFDLQMVSNPQISPDGEKIIYERHQFDIMTDRRFINLWSVAFSGDQHKALTSGKNNYGNVDWDPDGTRIAYTSTEEGASQIFIYWLESGETASITNLTESPGNLQWSPDGEYILFTKNVEATKPSIGTFPGPPEGAEWESPAKVIEHVTYRQDGAGFVDLSYSHIFLISADGGSPRQLTSGNYNHNSPSWSPEGHSIIFTADRSGNESLDSNNAQIYEIDIESEELTQRTDKRGPHQNPVISPDGSYISFTGYEDEFTGYQLTELYIMDRDGSDLRVISDSFEHDISSIEWAQDSGSIYFQFDEEGETKIGNIELNGNFSVLVSGLGSASIGRPYGGGSYSVAENGRFAFSHITSSRPAELAVGHYPTRMAIRIITDLNKELFKSKITGNVEEIGVESSVDDFAIQGWIITPPDFDPNTTYPLILEIHGGPYANYGPRFSPELQIMASKGYVVLYTNPRGSTGYGEIFCRLH